MLLGQAIPQFLLWVRNECSYSPATFTNYEHHMRVFTQWYGAFNKVEDITREHISEYREYLRKQKNKTGDGFVKTSTQEERIKVLKRFLKFCYIHDIKTLPFDKIENKRMPRQERPVMNDNELDLLLTAPDTNTLEGVRDRAILEFFYSTGCRLSEVIEVKIHDINWEEKQVIVNGKGGKSGVVYLNDRCLYWINEYIQMRSDNSDALFTHTRNLNPNSRRDGHLGKRSVGDIIKKYIKKARLNPNFSTHTLRHTFATNLRRKGVDLLQVSKMLRHNSIDSTQIYTHVMTDEMRQTHQDIIGI